MHKRLIKIHFLLRNKKKIKAVIGKNLRVTRLLSNNFGET
jgi:3-methyladenine DNA glycosylase Tag